MGMALLMLEGKKENNKGCDGKCSPYPSHGIQGAHRGLFKGGVTEGGGFHTPVRGTMFVCNGAVTPGPPRECDITFFAKGRPKSARQSRDSTVAARGVQSVTVPSSRVSRECRSPGLRSPPFRNARAQLVSPSLLRITDWIKKRCG